MLNSTNTASREGEIYKLGNVDFRILAATDRTEGAFAIGEFSGGEGSWTVPHIHAASLEAFYVRGESLSQMSASFEAPIGTIKRRLHVARKRLARQLEAASAV